MTAESLTGNQLRASILVAEDEITDTEIAAQVGIAQRTLERWKLQPDFAAAVKAHIDRLGTELSRYSIARKDKRVAALQERRDRLLMVVKDRSADEDAAHIPGYRSGYRSGYMVARLKMLGTGEFATTVDEYEVDTGLVSALNATEKQAAIEVGQFITKNDLTSGGESLLRQYVGIDPESI